MSCVPRLHHPSGLVVAMCASLALAACTDRGEPLAPREPDDGPLAAIECTARIAARTLSCASPRRSGSRQAAVDLLYGGQHQFVDVISGPAVVAADTVVFTVALRNLIPQPIGTTDGASADPDGTKVLVLMAVADEAGLNQDLSCAFFPDASHPWIAEGLAQLDSLGASRIHQYCFRSSWAMVAIKGTPAATVESLDTTAQVSAQLTATLH